MWKRVSMFAEFVTRYTDKQFARMWWHLDVLFKLFVEVYLWLVGS